LGGEIVVPIGGEEDSQALQGLSGLLFATASVEASMQCQATAGGQRRQWRRKEQRQQSRVIMCFVLINYHCADSQK
jgi:hypothetical protein